eukprot:11197700-Lingulodinium_polyedra.AAC.1
MPHVPALLWRPQPVPGAVVLLAPCRSWSHALPGAGSRQTRNKEYVANVAANNLVVKRGVGARDWECC